MVGIFSLVDTFRGRISSRLRYGVVVFVIPVNLKVDAKVDEKLRKVDSVEAQTRSHCFSCFLSI